MSDPLRIALNITHPAHFHFFKNAIRIWQERGHDVLLLARDKDLTLALLEESNLEAKLLSKARGGLVGLTIELFEHSMGVYQAIHAHNSQVIAAIGGTFIGYPALFHRIPSLIFYDTENAKLSNRITYPVATRVFTPRAYRHDIGRQQERYPGYHELAYLHPNYFTPDPDKLKANDLTPEDPFTLVRLVSWQSHHDVHDYGVQDVYKMIQTLEQYGRVIISSEAQLPADLEGYQYRGDAKDIHHVMAYAQLLFGESATMASEAAMLGVPAVFLSSSSRGYTDEQQTRYGLVYNFNGENALQERALAQAEAILQNPTAKRDYRAKQQHMLSELIDVSGYIVKQVELWARRTR